MQLRRLKKLRLWNKSKLKMLGKGYFAGISLYLNQLGITNNIITFGFDVFRTYRERVEMLRTKKLEIKAARSVIYGKGTEVAQEESSPEESSSDDDNDDVLTVDWRAKHL